MPSDVLSTEHYSAMYKAETSMQSDGISKHFSIRDLHFFLSPEQLLYISHHTRNNFIAACVHPCFGFGLLGLRSSIDERRFKQKHSTKRSVVVGILHALIPKF